MEERIKQGQEFLERTAGNVNGGKPKPKPKTKTKPKPKVQPSSMPRGCVLKG